MRRWGSVQIARIVGSLIIGIGCCAVTCALDAPVVRKSHPWGRFRPGSWKQVRLVTEALDAQGNVTMRSIARTRTTLITAGDEGVSLKVEATVDVAGKQVESAPQTVTQGWHGETLDRQTTITDLGDGQVTIAGVRVPCRIEQAETQTPTGRIVTKTWHSARVSPYVLRRESATYDSESDEAVSQTQVEVVALSRSIRVLRRRREAAELQVVYTHPGGMTRTKLWSSLEVPGGVVAHESEEFDTEGKITRRSKLELLGYSGEFTFGPLR